MAVAEQGYTNLFCSFSPPYFSSPQLGLASFTCVLVVSEDLSQSGNLLMTWVWGKREEFRDKLRR